MQLRYLRLAKYGLKRKDFLFYSIDHLGSNCGWEDSALVSPARGPGFESQSRWCQEGHPTTIVPKSNLKSLEPYSQCSLGAIL